MLGKSLDWVWQEYVLLIFEWDIYICFFYEMELCMLLCVIYSWCQFFELMVCFWYDYFNVYGEEVGLFFMIYDCDVICWNVFGNFCVLFGDVVCYLVMFEYFDNKYNLYEFYFENDGFNENFLCELFEFYILGVEYYFCNVDLQVVLFDGQGWLFGYIDVDVIVVVCCFIGWMVCDQFWFEEIGNEGGFFYYYLWYDDVNDKVVFGQVIIDKYILMCDGEDLFDVFVVYLGMVCFVVCKFCCCFVVDVLSEVLVDVVVVIFCQNQ